MLLCYVGSRSFDNFNYLPSEKRTNVLEFAPVKELYKFQGVTVNPCQKPVSLLSYIIQHHSKQNETILDLFSGSGSAAEAAIRCKRNVIAVELDTKQVNCIKNQLNTTTEDIHKELEEPEEEQLQKTTKKKGSKKKSESDDENSESSEDTPGIDKVVSPTQVKYCFVCMVPETEEDLCLICPQCHQCFHEVCMPNDPEYLQFKDQSIRDLEAICCSLKCYTPILESQPV